MGAARAQAPDDRSDQATRRHTLLFRCRHFKPAETDSLQVTPMTSCLQEAGISRDDPVPHEHTAQDGQAKSPDRPVPAPGFHRNGSKGIGVAPETMFVLE